MVRRALLTAVALLVGGCEPTTEHREAAVPPAAPPPGPAACPPVGYALVAAPAASTKSSVAYGWVPCFSADECARMRGGAPSTFDSTEALHSATRKMNQGDGAGCLADLDRIDAMDPKTGRYMGHLRGQCEMLAGRCQAGKQRLTEAFKDQGAMAPEQIEKAVESLGAMYCRGGDQTPRDRLLAALNDLMQGGYVTKKTPAFCQAAYETARQLKGSVTPKDLDDHQVRDAPKALFATAAACFARAGDCAGARRVFDESFPAENLSGVTDPAARKKVLDETFASMNERCKGPP